jgi:hypothetical protein
MLAPWRVEFYEDLIVRCDSLFERGLILDLQRVWGRLVPLPFDLGLGSRAVQLDKAEQSQRPPSALHGGFCVVVVETRPSQVFDTTLMARSM